MKNVTGNLISRETLKKAIETYDKFACLPDTKLMPFRELNEPEKDYEPYVRLRDIRNAIDNAPTVVNEKLINEYISKVGCCDECFASVYCTVNGLRESRVPQEYCVENIKRYFGDK